MAVIDQILSAENIEKAVTYFEKKNGSPDPGGHTAQQAGAQVRRDIEPLSAAVRNGTYHPSPAHRFYIENNGKRRPLDSFLFIDRIVQRMVSQVLGEIFDPGFSPNSHGFRPGRGKETAASDILDVLNQNEETYILKLDISKYFQNINQTKLLSLVSQKVDDPAVLGIIQSFLRAGYVENNVLNRSNRGLPQGSALSPLLSNIYLNELDQEMDSRGIPIIRFADDAVILGTKQECEVVKNYLTHWLPNTLDLELSPEKTIIGLPNECGVLGYNFVKNADGSWTTDKPLPDRAHKSKRNTPKASRSVVEVPANDKLRGLRDIHPKDVNSYFISKSDREKIKAAVNTQFTVEQIASALGFTVVSVSQGKLSLKEHDSCIIFTDSNTFTRFSVTRDDGKPVGGGPIDFFEHFSTVIHGEEMTYAKAINVFRYRVDLTKPIEAVKTTQSKKERSPFERDITLRKQAETKNSGTLEPSQATKRVYAYLTKTRCIDSSIVSDQIKKGNISHFTDSSNRTCCLFINKDENNLWTAACFRSTNSKLKFMGDFSGCDYEKGWFVDPQWNRTPGSQPNPHKQLLCFESYIEMLSYMTILKEKGRDYRDFAYVACGSVSKSRCIDYLCEKYNYGKVTVMFNNDREQEAERGENPGKDAAERTANRLKGKGINASVLLPSNHNDWNDMLKDMKSKSVKHEKKINKCQNDLGR